MNILLEYIIRFLIRKPTIGAKHYGNIPGVSLAYEIYHRSYPVGIIRPMIGMSTPFSEDHIYKERAPAYMKWLKSLLTLVSNLATFMLNSTVIIQYHGINAQFYYKPLKSLGIASGRWYETEPIVTEASEAILAAARGATPDNPVWLLPVGPTTNIASVILQARQEGWEEEFQKRIQCKESKFKSGILP